MILSKHYRRTPKAKRELWMYDAEARNILLKHGFKFKEPKTKGGLSAYVRDDGGMQAFLLEGFCMLARKCDKGSINILVDLREAKPDTFAKGIMI